jgi:hypothetical protein
MYKNFILLFCFSLNIFNNSFSMMQKLSIGEKIFYYIDNAKTNLYELFQNQKQNIKEAEGNNTYLKDNNIYSIRISDIYNVDKENSNDAFLKILKKPENTLYDSIFCARGNDGSLYPYIIESYNFTLLTSNKDTGEVTEENIIDNDIVLYYSQQPTCLDTKTCKLVTLNVNETELIERLKQKELSCMAVILKSGDWSNNIYSNLTTKNAKEEIYKVIKNGNFNIITLEEFKREASERCFSLLGNNVIID